MGTTNKLYEVISGEYNSALLFYQHINKRLLYSWELIQGLRELNPRHAALETAALPTELRPYKGRVNNNFLMDIFKR